MEIKTTRDLRGFLAETMVMVRNGDVDSNQANSISKLCAQINNSLAIEVNAAVKAGLTVGDTPPVVPALTDKTPPPTPPLGRDPLDDLPDEQEVWCDQCDGLVKVEDARGCKSKLCKAGS